MVSSFHEGLGSPGPGQAMATGEPSTTMRPLRPWSLSTKSRLAQILGAHQKKKGAGLSEETLDAGQIRIESGVGPGATLKTWSEYGNVARTDDMVDR